MSSLPSTCDGTGARTCAKSPEIQQDPDHSRVRVHVERKVFPQCREPPLMERPSWEVGSIPPWQCPGRAGMLYLGAVTERERDRLDQMMANTCLL